MADKKLKWGTLHVGIFETQINYAITERKTDYKPDMRGKD
jgi:hypothetical protein